MAPRRPSPKVPTVVETLQHPAFPSAIWNLEPDRKGRVPVAQGRGGPVNIAWEIHGVGPIKLVFIIGLGGFKSAWQRQTLHFGHERRDQYSVLLLDNRGMGDSDKPLMRYSTREMALDIAELLADPAIGWLPSYPLPTHPHPTRNLHVVGISLGGMIAQELAILLPASISSLSLICTAAAVENTTTFTEHMMQRAALILPKSVDRSIADTAKRIFSHGWLDEPDDVHLPDPTRTPKCKPPGDVDGEEYKRFATNAERFVAMEMHKRLDPERFGVRGFMMQLIAAGWHHKSAQQLAAMADAIGRERILVMHGTEDGMISVPHGRKLIGFIKPGRGLILEGMGHAPIAERWEWFNKTVEEQCALGEKLDDRV